MRQRQRRVGAWHEALRYQVYIDQPTSTGSAAVGWTLSSMQFQFPDFVALPGEVLKCVPGEYMRLKLPLSRYGLECSSSSLMLPGLGCRIWSQSVSRPAIHALVSLTQVAPVSYTSEAVSGNVYCRDDHPIQSLSALKSSILNHHPPPQS